MTNGLGEKQVVRL